MLSLTTEAKQAWLAQTRQVSARITIGTTVYNADKIMSVEYDSGSISGETFQIGSFYQNSIKVVLVGILESLTNDNKVKLEFAVKVGSSFVWTNMGTFYVSELDRDRNSNRTSFTAVDGSTYLGSTYNPTITFPNSLKNLVTDIANQCGVQVNFASMTHLADVSVVQPPSKYTCRQVISMVAQIHGGFARMNRNDELEVTRLMSTDLELNPSQYLLKGLTKNETTYRTDGIIVKTGDNDTDKIQVGTVTGSAVINLENPLMTQQLLDTMWQTVSTISYYPFTLKWRGIPNLEAGDWITVVDKQGTRFRVPNLSYKLSFKGGLSATSSANTTATSNVQHRLRGTLTQRVEDVEGYVNATGGRSYAGLDVPDSKYLKKGDTWYKPDGDDTAILVYDGTQWQEVASPEVFRQLQANLDALDQQAQEAFDKVDVLVQESPETKRLAQEAQNAVNLANQEIARLQTSVTDTKNDLASAEQEFANSLATTTRELTAKISGIDVGGHNLLRKSAVSEENLQYLKATNATVSVVTEGNLKYYKIRINDNLTTDSNGAAYLSNDGYYNLVKGKHYIFSYWIKVNKNYNFHFTSIGHYQTINYRDSDIGDRLHVDTNRGYSVSNLASGTWVKVAIEFDMLYDGYFIPSFWYITSGTEICVYDMMLEEGNKPTAWSPAPEDFQSDLSNISIELSTKITESAASLRTEMSEKYSTKNDLTTLQGDYDSFKQQTAQGFSQQASSIQTIQTNTDNATQLANNAITKANEAINSADNATTTSNSALSTANTAKSNADKAIADVASLTQTVSSQSTRIDQTSNRIEQVANGVVEIGNRTVGGTNLIRNTSSQLQHIESASWHTIAETSNKSVFNLANYLGKRLTLRVWIQNPSVDSKLQLYFNADGWKAGNVVNAGQSGYSQLTCDIPSTLPSFWNLVLGNGNGTQLDYKELKAETGDFATSWSPAPEDQQSQIDGINNNLSNNYYQKSTVDAKLSTATSGITAQYTSDINTKLANYYDKSTMDRKLTIDGQGIETYVKNTKSQLDGLQVGGTNLIRNTNTDKMSITWSMQTGDYEVSYYTNNGIVVTKLKRGNVAQTGWSVINVRGLMLNKLKPNTKYTVTMEIASTSGKTLNFCLRNNDGTAVISNLVSGALVANEFTKVSFILTTTNPMNVVNQVIYITEVDSSVGTEYHFKNIKMEEGNTPTDWSPAPEDFPTLTQYTEVKQLADRISSTVYDSASGLVTKTNQLAGKYAITNLNSYGDVLSSLNLNGGDVRIKGGLIDLDGNVNIQDAFVTNLKANSILAEEITAKATTVVNARISNLDAGVITTGILKGTNLSLNLGTGDVQFKKGRIQAPNNTLDIQVDTGIMKVLNTNGEGVTFQNGNLYFSNATEQSYFGSLIYNNQLFSNSFKGVSLIGKNAFQIKTSDYKDLSLSFATPQIGAGISASSNGMVLQSDKRVNIVGGQPSGELTTPAMISIGTTHGSYSGNGNGVTINGYSDGIYLSVVNGGKISMFGDVEFISGTITGPIVKSTDFSVKNMTFVFSTDGSYIKVETSFGTFKIPVSS